MDTDVKALPSPDIELSSTLVQALSHLAERCQFVVVFGFVLFLYAFKTNFVDFIWLWVMGSSG